MKTILAILVLTLLSSSAVLAVETCNPPIPVSLQDKVGTSRVLDMDALGLMNAIHQFPADYDKLRQGRRLLSVVVSIEPSKDASRFSNITRYTLSAGVCTGSFVLTSCRATAKVQWDSYLDETTTDDMRRFSETSGVIELPKTTDGAAQ